jgi:hypothetical protein
LRRVPLRQFSVEDLRIMIGQNIDHLGATVRLRRKAATSDTKSPDSKISFRIRCYGRRLSRRSPLEEISGYPALKQTVNRILFIAGHSSFRRLG